MTDTAMRTLSSQTYHLRKSHMRAVRIYVSKAGKSCTALLQKCTASCVQTSSKFASKLVI